MQPTRSLLYMPGANARALDKARTLSCDCIIFDLEDAVAVAAKATARDQVVAAIKQGGYGYRQLVVRCNGLDTPWGKDDLAACAGLDIHALLFPKIQSSEQIQQIRGLLAGHGSNLPIWIMIETPTGIVQLTEFAGDAQVSALVMGTSDLVKELRAQHTPDRSNLDYALQHAIVVARHFGKDIFDGVHLDFRNLDSLQSACEQGRAMGFDGKTLIHPGQIEVANQAFGFSETDVEQAGRVLAVWQQTQKEGLGVAVLDGNLIENLHAEEAQRVIDFATALAERAALADSSD